MNFGEDIIQSIAPGYYSFACINLHYMCVYVFLCVFLYMYIYIDV